LSRKRQVLAASYLNNGGFMYAFPNVHNPLTGTQESGMTLRDYFAAAALTGMLAENGGGALHNQDLAEFAYALADSMMIARDK